MEFRALQNLFKDTWHKHKDVCFLRSSSNPIVHSSFDISTASM